MKMWANNPFCIVLFVEKQNTTTIAKDHCIKHVVFPGTRHIITLASYKQGFKLPLSLPLRTLINSSQLLILSEQGHRIIVSS